MKNYLNYIVILILLLFANKVQGQISETKYDYSFVAEEITKGCTNKLEQAESIYQWLCENIAYDTTHQIFTADECFDQKRGVCQAYCELFYRLGETLGLNTTIIPGRTKDPNGKIETTKHAWLYVEVDEGGILIDPTWGAGSIKDNVFKRSDNDMSWFQIDPHWLIFTHYPDEKRYQFLEKAIDWNTFVRLPALYPSSGEYGWSGEKVLSQMLEGNLKSLPKIYEQYSHNVELTDIPMQETLRPGQLYTFTLRKKTSNNIVLEHDGEFIDETKWEKNDDYYTLKYMPVSSGTLNLAIADTEKSFNVVVLYQVSSPTPVDLKNIERHSPLRMPEIKRLKNLDLEKWNTIIGDNGTELLQKVRKENIKSLPILYRQAAVYLRDVHIPYSETLKAGTTYTFSFIPQGGQDWQIICKGADGDKWYGDWVKDETTGRYTLQVTPHQAGKLRLSVRIKDGKTYESMIGYEVK